MFDNEKPSLSPLFQNPDGGMPDIDDSDSRTIEDQNPLTRPFPVLSNSARYSFLPTILRQWAGQVYSRKLLGFGRLPGFKGWCIFGRVKDNMAGPYNATR